MNSTFMAIGSYPLGATSGFIAFLPIEESLITFDAVQQLSHLLIAPSFIPSTESAIAQGPTVLKSKPLSEDYDAKAAAFRHFLDSLESEEESTTDNTPTKQ